MLNSIQLRKMAEVLIWGIKTARAEIKNGQFSKGDIVRVTFDPDPQAETLAEYLQRGILEEGWHPVIRGSGTDRMEHDFLKYSSKEQRTHIAPWEAAYLGNLHATIGIIAPGDLFNTEDIDPKRMTEIAVARKPLRDIIEQREAQGLFGWTLCVLPTAGCASQAKISLRQYTDEVVKACYLDLTDPVAKWQGLKQEAEEIKAYLKGLNIEKVRVESENMDVTYGLGEGRRFVGLTGHNVPSFEIFTCPDKRLTNGKFYAEIAAFKMGRYVRGVHLDFKDGRVVSAFAEEGDEFLQAQLDTDDGARMCGEMSFTDKRFSPITKIMASTLYDENFGGEYGNHHMALGLSFPDAYDGDNFNEIKEKLGFNDSAIHWDLINHEKKDVMVYTKGGGARLIYQNGEFIIR